MDEVLKCNIRTLEVKKESKTLKLGKVVRKVYISSAICKVLLIMDTVPRTVLIN